MSSLSKVFLITVLIASALRGSAEITVTVNSTGITDVPDAELTLVEAVAWINKPGYRTLTEAESKQVGAASGTNKLINFNIPGAGPFVITDCPRLEIMATNVVVNGYSQPGSSPNTNPILAANNAKLQVVLRSTEGARAFSVFGDHVYLRGLCLRNTRIAWGNGDEENGIRGGGVQGCWIGLAPDGTIDGGMSYCVALWYSTEGGQIIGTDGDGVNDRNEFNVLVAADEYHVAIGSPNCRLSGNFINVLPDGLTASGYSGAECDGIYIEEDASDSVIGTNSDGVSDDDERNIVGGLDGSGPCEVIGSWAGATKRLLVMGNYFGVGIDGKSPLPNKHGIAVDDPGTSIRVGSDGDGVRDELESNIIAYCTKGGVFKFSGQSTQLVFQRDSFFGNTAPFFRDNGNSYNGVIMQSEVTAIISPAVSNLTTRATLVGWVPVSGDPSALNRTNAQIHVYEADSDAAEDRPQGKKWLASFLDNGPHDRDGRTNYFEFSICSLPLASAGAKITVMQTCGDDLGGGSSPFATVLSLPDASNLLSSSVNGDSVTLSWQMNGVLQARPSLTSGSWTNVPGCSPVTLLGSAGSLFFRVKQ